MSRLAAFLQRSEEPPVRNAESKNSVDIRWRLTRRLEHKAGLVSEVHAHKTDNFLRRAILKAAVCLSVSQHPISTLEQAVRVVPAMKTEVVAFLRHDEANTAGRPNSGGQAKPGSHQSAASAILSAMLDWETSRAAVLESSDTRRRPMPFAALWMKAKARYSGALAQDRCFCEPSMSSDVQSSLCVGWASFAILKELHYVEEELRPGACHLTGGRVARLSNNGRKIAEWLQDPSNLQFQSLASSSDKALPFSAHSPPGSPTPRPVASEATSSLRSPGAKTGPSQGQPEEIETLLPASGEDAPAGPQYGLNTALPKLTLLKFLKLPTLAAHCKQRELKVTGTKDDLVTRLLDWQIKQKKMRGILAMTPSERLAFHQLEQGKASATEAQTEEQKKKALERKEKRKQKAELKKQQAKEAAKAEREAFKAKEKERRERVALEQDRTAIGDLKRLQPDPARPSSVAKTTAEEDVKKDIKTGGWTPRRTGARE